MYATESISIRVDPNGFSVITPDQVISHPQLSALLAQSPPLPFAVNILWTTPQVTLIPQEFYNPAALDDFLTTVGMPCDTPMANNTMHHQIVAVWNANAAATAQIDELLPNARHLHALQLLINQATEPNALYIVVENGMAHIVATADNEIAKALTAVVTSPEDVLYFAAATYAVPSVVKLFGDTSQITETLQPYFANVESFPSPNYLSLMMSGIQ